MKKLKALAILALPFIAVAVILFLMGHNATAGVVMAGIPMIGSTDMRIAYTNAYRSLWNKATNNGQLDPRKLGQAGGPAWLPNTGNKILSQSDLIVEILLNQNKTQYQFSINVGNNAAGQAQGVQERRLALQDVFFVAQVGYHMRVAATSGGSTDFQSQLFSHPPGWFFGGINLNRAVALWDGNLSLDINNRVVVPEWDLMRHYEAPQTQYPTFSTFVATQPYPVNDEFYGGQSGMYPTEPMWILDGSYDNKLGVAYNQALNTSGLAGSIYMRVTMRGILAQNCGKIMEPGIMVPESR